MFQAQLQRWTWRELAETSTPLLTKTAAYRNGLAKRYVSIRVFIRLLTRILQTFKLDVFYEKMAHYFVLGNVPFTEIEQDEFRDIISYGRPQLRSCLVGADQMKKKIYGIVEDADTWLMDYISVSVNFCVYSLTLTLHY